MPELSGAGVGLRDQISIGSEGSGRSGENDIVEHYQGKPKFYTVQLWVGDGDRGWKSRL